MCGRGARPRPLQAALPPSFEDFLLPESLDLELDSVLLDEVLLEEALLEEELLDDELLEESPPEDSLFLASGWLCFERPYSVS